MATLALSLAGQFVGGAVGGPLGATVGRALGALAGNAIDNALFAESPQVKAPSPFSLQGSAEGGVIPRIYGWNRIVGNVIWATNLERQTAQTSGAKGTQTDQNEEIIANFAIGLCEGEVAHVGRIWADGRLLETEGLDLRFYSGSQTQIADSLISIKQGAGNAPAYRGLCYLVFEGLPLGEFGNRIPNISVELCRVVGDLEPSIRAITLIPGSTEFGYDPEPRVRIVSPGVTASENTNLSGQTSDWTVSLDELQGLCPNLEHVALVVAWFGDDLRCGNCKIQPRVENNTKQVADTTWTVSGKTRAQVPLMTQFEGGPAYGGTPSDAAVLSAIADLKSRGIKVTLYPFVLMDISHTNSLPDPYTGGAGQPAYPWRGRITSAPAPGKVGSPDKSAAMNSQVNAFVGSAIGTDFSAATNTINYAGPLDWGYRRMILHYAHLSVLAGGVDAFLIGSEFRGLTWLRNSATGFPFVDALVTLAHDVRAIVGSSPNLTYGADWSEYSGLQPSDAPGDKLFHLDPLWASTDIDAIGIDNYMPLSDWRGNGDEPDQALTDEVYDLDYLQGNIAGGEGYDWYYASSNDRDNAVRTPISDGPENEPWVWRYKDLQNWWANTHHNRVGGVRNATSTVWVPQSKPIWLTELGCGAVDKGSNTPNVFGDPKSIENASPYFSDGTEDALIQRQFLRAHHQYWQPGSPTFTATDNPASSQYAGRMIDPERLYVWTWDARPYPVFPNRRDVWSDGANHAAGHWMTGRMGAMAADEFLNAIAKDYGVSFVSTDVCGSQIQGAQIAAMVSLRRAIEPMLETHGLFVRDQPEGVGVRRNKQFHKTDLPVERLCAEELPIYSRQRYNNDEAIGQLALTYLDRGEGYQSGTVT
ncbi:MAG TPA: host specificity protein, partial [Devosia sp.]|nr:host specificity protein [Devosia sp.]